MEVIFPKRVEYSYNAAGQRTATSVFAAADKVFDTLYGFDGMGRLTDLTHCNADKVFASYDYSWDIANRITGFDFTYLGAKDEKTAEYGYDQTAQLVSADYNAFQANELYEYDANGNRKNFENSANNLLTNDGEFCYTYDSEGNRIEKMSISTGVKTKYVWDHRNRLTQVVTPKESVLYSYDYLNRMTRRNSEFVVHDGWQIVLTLDTKGNVKNRNLWGANQDELIATNGQFTLCDHLGSVRDIVDARGKVVEHREYNAFGKVTKQTGKSDCVFGYTGKMFDDATGLQWNINRWYDSGVGQWVSEDPIGFESRDDNLCRYVRNAPTTLSDFDGLKVYAIDGTWSTGKSTNTRLIYSLLFNEWQGEYLEGPTDGIWGTDAITIKENLFQKICEDYLSADNAGNLDAFSIELLGWSRGAVAVVAVARDLNNIGCEDKCGTKQKPIEVKWIGLFDAVNQTEHPGWRNADLPQNVKTTNHFKKTYIPLAGSNPFDPENWMDVINYSPAINRHWHRPDGSVTFHSDIGRGWPVYAPDGALIGRSAVIAGAMMTIMRSHGIEFI